MPLIQGKSKKSFSSNVEREMHSGKPQKQALAIAYNVMKKNRAKKMASGGAVNEDLEPRSDVGMRSDPEQGMMHGPKHIAIMIHTKRMAKGGMADDCYEDGGPVLDPSKVDKFTKGFKSAFAEGGEVEGEDSDSELESLPFDNTDDVGVPDLGYHSAREDIEGQGERADMEDGSSPSDDDSLDSMGEPSRKGTLKRIMRGLHMRHMGR